MPKSVPAVLQAWRSRRALWGWTLLVTGGLSLVSAFVVMVTPGSSGGKVIRQALGVWVTAEAQHGTAQWIVAEDGRVFLGPAPHVPLTEYHTARREHAGQTAVWVVGYARGSRVRNGIWAATREKIQCGFYVHRPEVPESEALALKRRAIVDAALPTLRAELAKVHPAWWERFGLAAELQPFIATTPPGGAHPTASDPAVVRRVWSGLVHNAIAALLVVLLPVALVRWWGAHWMCRRLRVAVAKRRCPACHYDLTGISATVCPECGTRNDELFPEEAQ